MSTGGLKLPKLGSSIREASETTRSVVKLSEKIQTQTFNFSTQDQGMARTTGTSSTKGKPGKSVDGFRNEKGSRFFATDASNKFKTETQHSISDFYLAHLTKKSKADDLLKYEGTASDKLFKTASIQQVESLMKVRNDRVAKGLSTFKQSLKYSIKEVLKDSPSFEELFKQVDDYFYCFEEVNSRVKCYRPELGEVLGSLRTRLFNIFEKTFVAAIQLIEKHRSENERILENNLLEIQKLDKKQKNVEQKNREFQKLAEIKGSEAFLYQENMKALSEEVDYLQNVIQNDLALKGLKWDPSSNEVEDIPDFRSEDKLKNKHETLTNDLEIYLTRLNDCITEIEGEHCQKKQNIDEMNNLLKAMLKGQKIDESTQVNEGELFWGPLNVTKNDVVHINFGAVGFEMSTVNLEKPEIRKEIPAVSTVELVNAHENEQKMKKNEGDKETATQENNPKSEKGNSQGGVVQGLHSPGASPMKPAPQPVADNWTLPIVMVVFLENVSKTQEAARVLPWLFFKKLIFDIYHYRAEENWEVNGTVSNSFIPMEEFACIYFLRTHKLRRIAEIKLFEFLVSLKYYIKLWPRALMFANLCNITSTSKPQITPEPSMSSTYDVYVQNYFLFCFQRIYKEATFIVDSPDGFGFLLREKVDEVIKDCLFFMKDLDKSKLTDRIKKITQFYTDQKLGQAEFVDIDKLLAFFVDEYMDSKKKQFKQINNSMAKLFDNEQGIFSTDDIRSALSYLLSRDCPIPKYLYHKEFALHRAFLFALTCGNNDYEMKLKFFLEGVMRFGLDSPFPTVFSLGVGSGEIRLPKNEETRSIAEFSASKVGLERASRSKTRLLSKENLSAYEKKSEQSENKAKPVENAGDREDPKKNANREESNDLGGFKAGGGIKIDATSAMFAQHFSILRELRMYCSQFKEVLKNETDTELLWKNFENIVSILDAGCHFLNFPIQL